MSAQKACPGRATRRLLRAARSRAFRADDERFWRELAEQSEREWVAKHVGELADASVALALRGFNREAGDSIQQRQEERA